MTDINKSDKKIEPEVDPKDQQGNGKPEEPKNDDTTSEKSVPVGELIAERKKRQEYEKKLNEYEQSKEAERVKKLEEEGKLKELLDERDKKLKDLEPDALAFREYRESRIEMAKEKLGDKWKDSYSKLPLQDVEDLIALVSEPVKPPVDRSNSFTKSGGNKAPANFHEWANKYKE